MTNVNPLTYAIDYVMFWEDEKLEGKVTSDKGGKTRFGLAQKWNPELTDKNFYNAPRNEALRLARYTYATKYAPHVQAAKIVDQRVRAKVLDMYVNMGTNGVHIVQRACGAHEDGGVGPETLTLINGASPDRFLMRLVNLSLSYYSLLEGSPDEHKSWDRRARCLGEKGVNTTFGLGGHGEQILVPEQHGGRSGTSAALEGQRTSGSGMVAGSPVQKKL